MSSKVSISISTLRKIHLNFAVSVYNQIYQYLTTISAKATLRANISQKRTLFFVVVNVECTLNNEYFSAVINIYPFSCFGLISKHIGENGATLQGGLKTDIISVRLNFIKYYPLFEIISLSESGETL